MTRQKIAIYALTLMTVSHSSFLSAQSSPLEKSTMSWPMQQGESLNDVARLFYPDNQYMQRQFVAASITLNQAALPNLDAATAFTQESMIVIPDIKALSVYGQRDVAQTTKQGTTAIGASTAVASHRQQEGYEVLAQRNAVFNQELEKLNTRLTHLQQVFGALKPALMGLVEERAAPATVSQKPVMQAKALQTATLASKGQAPYINFWLSISGALLVVGLFAGFLRYTRRQSASLKQLVSANFASQEKKSYLEYLLSLRPWASGAAAPAMSLSEFSDSMSEFNPALVPDEKEEGEIILEQARIYVNLGRHGHAIRLLNAYIRAEPKAALHQWLYLLDIYRAIDLKDAFIVCAKQLHQTFNVVMPQWKQSEITDNVASLDPGAHSLEEYDHIVNKVTKLWADCATEAGNLAQTKSYLDELLTDTRDNQRNGFSMDVFEEIILLRDMLDAREKLAEAV